MKVAVTGKGGVGKTTVAASLARSWRDLGYKVVAVDADPDANLAGTLGYRGAPITPLVQLKQLIEERVGGGEGWGIGYFQVREVLQVGLEGQKGGDAVDAAHQGVAVVADPLGPEEAAGFFGPPPGAGT